MEEIGIREEVEQDLISRNVFVNKEEGYSSTNMPFIADPDERLVNNDWSARKIFDSQVKGLSKSDKDRTDTLTLGKKLVRTPFVLFSVLLLRQRVGIV